MRGRNVVSWTACFEWWRRGERVISDAVDDLLEIVKRETDCWEAGVRWAELLENVFYISEMQTLTLLPQSQVLQALPSSICTGTICFSGIVEGFWAEQKAPRTWWPRLKAAVRVCSSEQAQPEQNFHWVRLEGGKKNVKDKNMIWWPSETRGSELPEKTKLILGWSTSKPGWE